MEDQFIQTQIAGRTIVLCATKSKKHVVRLLIGITEDVISIGFSICNPNDKFNIDRGSEIAKGRATKKPIFTIPFHELFDQHVAHFLLQNAENLIKKDPYKYLKISPFKTKPVFDQNKLHAQIKKVKAWSDRELSEGELEAKIRKAPLVFQNPVTIADAIPNTKSLVDNKS